MTLASTASLSQARSPQDEAVRSAYRELLVETDRDKDGKISVLECQAIFKDPAMADKNCKFWDADHDGVITEDEYVAQVMSLGRRK
jgi:Ca2+-binding EF-hand superfamily protein